ncbi:MAG: hypothetical protein RJS98_15550, partial [Rhodospirillaceae bacterium]
IERAIQTAIGVVDDFKGGGNGLPVGTIQFQAHGVAPGIADGLRGSVTVFDPAGGEDHGRALLATSMAVRRPMPELAPTTRQILFSSFMWLVSYGFFHLVYGLT